jgi:iron(III) transport system permease protein
MTIALARSTSNTPGGTLSSHTHWDRTALAVAVLVLLPLMAITGLALGAGEGGTLAHLAQTVLAPALWETLVMATGVLALALLTGVTTGWLVATYRFPGRDILGWALILPFAIPTYISAYAYVEALDYFGPVQTVYRTLLGVRLRREYAFPEVRSLGGAIFVTSLVLYPYVYVAARAAFTMQGANLLDAARSLGCSRLEALRRVVLPVIAPMLAAAGTLVVLETLNDIGASQYLGVNTLTVAIYTTWLSKGNLAGAAQIALITLAAVIGVLWLERALRNNRRFTLTSRNYRPVTPPVLVGWRGLVAFVATVMPVLLGFALPVAVLVRGGWREFMVDGIQPEMLRALWNTILVASLATIVILGLAMLLAFARRFSRHARTVIAVRISGIGYAVPGTVLVIGLLPALGLVDRLINDVILAAGGSRIGLVLSGSIIAIVLAYTIRFLAIGIEQAETGLASLSRNTDYAAHTLGCPERRLAWRILAPALRPVLAGAAVLIFVDCLKELPATLLLRPLNFETLATHLYGHATRGSFEDGAIAALLIVAAGLVPLILMNRMMERHGGE